MNVATALSQVNVSSFLPAELARRLPLVNPRGPVRTAVGANGIVLSAISDRDFLEVVLDNLAPLDGKKVFEIGSGTGYLAYVMSQLVGPLGHVTGCEIIETLYAHSVRNPLIVSQPNITLVAGDFIDILPQPSDVIISTSSMDRFHRSILLSLKDGGYLAVPIAIPGGGDCFSLFRYWDGWIRCYHAILSVSVPTRGSYSPDAFWAPHLDKIFPGVLERDILTVRHRPKAKHHIHESLCFRSYLHFTERRFFSVNLGKVPYLAPSTMGFGLRSSGPDNSFAISAFDRDLVHGADGLALLSDLHNMRSEWERSGSPSLSNFRYDLPVPTSADLVFSAGFGSMAVRTSSQ
ncbi:protein-L-isoaspartate O-methyltransferase [Bradyrhizobium sp. Pha-3]|uniref:protein-L-isoaspartate O-methyltransferase family protein n=1 Tax=Bradyrhizobium sp. Pha-3 TaxID=208375 RepID=UPI0035D4409A